MISSEEIKTVICQRLGHLAGYDWADISDDERMEAARLVFAKMQETGDIGYPDLLHDAMDSVIAGPSWAPANPFNPHDMIAVNQYLVKVLGDYIEDEMYDLKEEATIDD